MTVFYQWYDHLIRRTEEGWKVIKAIEQALEEHNFEKFMQLHDYLNGLEKDMIFLPDEGFAYEDGSDDPELVDITVKENFMKISENQYECG